MKKREIDRPACRVYSSVRTYDLAALCRLSIDVPSRLFRSAEFLDPIHHAKEKHGDGQAECPTPEGPPFQRSARASPRHRDAKLSVPIPRGSAVNHPRPFRVVHQCINAPMPTQDGGVAGAFHHARFCLNVTLPWQADPPHRKLFFFFYVCRTTGPYGSRQPLSRISVVLG